MDCLSVSLAPLAEGALLSVALAPRAQSLPLCLVCVVDRSGSMDLPSQEPRPGAQAEPGTLFSRMDLVQHAMRTVVELLRAQDWLVLVSFADAARLELACTRMDAAGKAQARAAVARLAPGGGTNLWKGLELGIDVAAQAPAGVRVALVLQTDGEPTREYLPLRGIPHALEARLGAARRGLAVHSCGYGFGDALDSGLLRAIAQCGRGSYAYIPDGSMVGTVFVHLLCNLLSVALADVQVLLAPGAEVCRVGALSAGQTKRFVVRGARAVRVTSEQGAQALEGVEAAGTARPFDAARDRFVRVLEQAVALAEQDRAAEAQAALAEFAAELRPLAAADARAARLLQDLLPSAAPETGQLDKALRHWARWGRHYLPSALSAHARQEKVSFKDASLEMYSTPALDAAVAAAEAVFAALPPPVAAAAAFARASPGAVLSMASMISPASGCFSGGSRLQLEGGGTARVAALRKGQRLAGGAAVLCVVRFRGARAALCRAEGLALTAHHPVRLPGASQWAFPRDCLAQDARERPCTLYNLVLDRDHVVRTAAGLQCVTLGHGLVDDAVVRHPYFGTDLVLRDLQRRPGYHQGLVDLVRAEFRVDPNTGLVCGLAE